MIRGFILWGITSLLLAPAASSAAAQTVAAQPENANHATPELPALERPARLKVTGVSLTDALSELTERSGVVIAYSPSRLASEAPVDCDCAELTVAEALERLLASTQYRYAEVDGHVVVVQRQISNPGPRGVRPSPQPVFVMLTSVSKVPNPPRQQVGTVIGTVSEIESGIPVVNAQLLIDGRGRAFTDAAGRFRIANVPAGRRTMGVVSIGYRKAEQEVEIGDGATVTVDFELVVAPTSLAEVVVTAIGEQRRIELGHVLGSIRADSVARNAPVTSLSDLIGARVPGLQISANRGSTGESPRIRIRGLGSISRDRDPLVYVDGVRVESSPASVANPVFGSALSNFGFLSGRFNDLSPEEIESIEVVKGPSAATLYGTDAANGVILIRTKRGRPGSAQWNVFFEGGILQPAESFGKIDSYYAWGTNTATQQPQRCILVQMAAGACVQDSVTVFNPLTHPETSPIGTGTRSRFGARVSGGAAQLTYLLSAEYEQETGYLRMPALEIQRVRDQRGGAELPDWQLRPNTLERLNLRGSLDASIGDDADVQVSSGLVFSSTRIPNNWLFQAGSWGPGYRDANDGWIDFFQGPGEIFAVRSVEGVVRYITSVSANWRPFGWLSTRAVLGTDQSSANFDGLQRHGEGPAFRRDGHRLDSRTNVAQYTIDLGASAAAGLTPQVKSRTSVGVQYNGRRQRVTIASASGLPPGSETVAGAASVTGGEGRMESVVAGAYLEQMVGLNDRLFLVGAVRADGASSFGRNFATAIYPKASASWLISQEPFFPSLPALGNMRLRLAYGRSGVQPGSTDALELMTRFTSVINGVTTSGAALGRLGNPNLKPEGQREFESGLDLDDLFHGRVSLEATYYDRRSTDALLLAPLAPSLGLGSRWENVGSVRNWGYEAMLRMQLLESSRLSWEAMLNGSVNHNRLERLGIPGVTSLGDLLSHHREGFPAFGRWARPILGYSDANNNGIIEPEEVQIGDTVVYFGPSHPPRQLTVSTTLAILDGRLRLSSQFDYRGGHVGINSAAALQCVIALSCRALNDPESPLPEQARAVAQVHHLTDAGYLEDASFVRWRELSATYRVPARLTLRLGASDLSVTLSGRNLRLWTDYTGLDPEVNGELGFSSEGSSGGATAPQTRYWLVRVDARI